MTSTSSDAPVCVVIGVGPGLGGAYARRFHRAGYQVALLARSTAYAQALAADLGTGAQAYACDVTDPGAIAATFTAIAHDLGPVDVLAYNAGSGSFATVDDITPEAFETAWQINARGLLLSAQAIIPGMQAKGAGAIVITGATASRRGAAFTTGFASAKAAQRSLAESMAKHLGPQGIHVSLIIVDGVVDLPRTREMIPDQPDSFFLAPDDVAETAYWLTQQPRSAWSFEVEARPFAEKW